MNPPAKTAKARKAPSDALERRARAEGFQLVAGLDEVGRGAWAGPVSVGVAVAPVGVRCPKGVRDSKLLAEADREALFPAVAAWCAAWSVGHADPGECDRLGMTAALRLAAGRALAGLGVVPDVVLADGAHDYVTAPAIPVIVPSDDVLSVIVPSDDVLSPVGRTAGAGLAANRAPEGAVDEAALAIAGTTADGKMPQIRTVVGGDRSCRIIAAASILAKVTRDRMMRELAESFPGFDFDRNKGYPSPTHRRALAGTGLTSIHRRSWSYVDYLPFR